MKDIPDFEGRYAITRNGRVWSYPKKGGTRKGKWIRAFIQHRGYYNYYLQKANGKRRIILAHRLVATTYIPNLLGRKEVNHKDGEKLNNRVKNLEWCTHQENMRHAYKNGLVTLQHGEDHKLAKLTQSKANKIRSQYINGDITQRQLAKIYDVNQKLIWLILHKKIWNY